MIIRLIITSLVAFALSYILSGVSMDSFWTAILLAVVLGLLNLFVRPLITLFTLPITLLTLGLFLFVIDALIILLADAMLGGFAVANFWWALLFGLLLSITTSILYRARK